jgi:uncharacterized protein YidB (DUF937 family)
MGLMDILNGMQNGPRGQTDPNAKGRMSPITMAILALLAYKALKGMGGHQTAPNSPSPAAPPASGGGLGDLGGLLQGGLGGLLGGAAAGSVLSGGLNDLLKQFQQTGHSDAANSWVGSGPNKSISPIDLASALGADKINALAAQSGMSRDDLLQGLSEYLPQVVDQMTPQGRMPTEQEIENLF